MKYYELKNFNRMAEEDKVNYGNVEFPLQKETYRIIGACVEVHNELGRGYHEIVYKDALEIEFKLQEIPYIREKEFKTMYKGFDLKRNYNADFLVFDGVVLEVKADTAEFVSHSKQVLNYLASSGCKVALYVNFGSDSLKFNRMIL